MDGTAARELMYQDSKARLQQLAWRAYQRGRTNQNTVIVCIEVDDPVWKPLVDELMPGHDWQAMRDRGETPVARGSVRADLIEGVLILVPSLSDALSGPAPAGLWRVIVMGMSGASVHQIVPHPEPS